MSSFVEGKRAASGAGGPRVPGHHEGKALGGGVEVSGELRISL